MFNLKSIRQTDSATVQILNPHTKAPTGATVQLAGPEHPRRKALMFEAQRKARAQLQKTGRVRLEDPETSAEEDLDYLAACTLDWDGIADETGAPIPWSQAKARELYADPELAWLRDQVREALNDRENFIRSCEPRS